MTIKLIKACKELNIGISTAIEYCRKKGIHISSDPNTRIDDDTFQLLSKRFNSDMEMKLESELLAQEHQDVHIQSLAIDEPQSTMPTPTTDTAPNVDNLLLINLGFDSTVGAQPMFWGEHRGGWFTFPLSAPPRRCLTVWCGSCPPLSFHLSRARSPR